MSGSCQNGLHQINMTAERKEPNAKEKEIVFMVDWVETLGNYSQGVFMFLQVVKIDGASNPCPETTAISSNSNKQPSL